MVRILEFSPQLHMDISPQNHSFLFLLVPTPLPLSFLFPIFGSRQLLQGQGLSLGLLFMIGKIRWISSKEEDLLWFCFPLYVIYVARMERQETTYSCIVSLLHMCGPISNKGSLSTLLCRSLLGILLTNGGMTSEG